MARGMSLVWCACACSCAAGCSARELTPALSVHTVLVLHQRAAAAREHRRGHDVAVTAQLAFGGARPQRHAAAVRERALSPLAGDSSVACEESALCEWARMAEESALAALGVRP